MGCAELVLLKCLGIPLFDGNTPTARADRACCHSSRLGHSRHSMLPLPSGSQPQNWRSLPTLSTSRRSVPLLARFEFVAPLSQVYKLPADTPRYSSHATARWTAAAPAGDGARPAHLNDATAALGVGKTLAEPPVRRSHRRLIIVLAAATVALVGASVAFAVLSGGSDEAPSAGVGAGAPGCVSAS